MYSVYHLLIYSRGTPPCRFLSTCEGVPFGLADAESIFALSSGHGRCGVAVVRASGPASATALRCMAGVSRSPPPPRTALLRSIRDPISKEVLDRGLVFWFPGPHSFTGEDSVEFHIHGGPAVEGLGDLIHAETEAQRRQALRQMSGELGHLYQDWTHRLKRCLAHVEAFIDFSEDELIEDGVLNQVDRWVCDLQAEMERHLKDERRGERLRSGVQVVIAGATNAGKMEQADLTLVVADCADLPSDAQQAAAFLQEHLRSVLPPQEQPETVFPADRCLLVLNKMDLLPEDQRLELDGELRRVSGFPPVCLISCHTKEGLHDFLTVLHSSVKTLCGDPLSGAPTLTQARHRAHLQQCFAAMAQYQRYRDLDLALAAEGVRLALTSLGRITGRVGAEEILDIIFKDFCIGK
ncbi:hypothetical protein F7725_027875 [Dissostichus mawsoni]|uniref:MnmE helical domain-containing protein n=1 Tax=Dissostichus mawsoni TaxID=36200 RepID=A0A7J5XFG3_DISMA|nr:hypothetical protein F7725_027875 [Dissostichus mawsoni]